VAQLLQQFGMGQHFVLNVLSQGIKFGREIVMKRYLPFHVLSMHLKDIMLSSTYSSLLFGLGFIGMIRRFLFFALFNQQPVGRNLDIPNAAELQLALQINRDDFMIED
jgi:hypothetical protein